MVFFFVNRNLRQGGIYTIGTFSIVPECLTRLVQLIHIQIYFHTFKIVKWFHLSGYFCHGAICITLLNLYIMHNVMVHANGFAYF